MGLSQIKRWKRKVHSRFHFPPHKLDGVHNFIVISDEFMRGKTAKRRNENVGMRSINSWMIRPIAVSLFFILIIFGPDWPGICLRMRERFHNLTLSGHSHQEILFTGTYMPRQWDCERSHFSLCSSPHSGRSCPYFFIS